jgi:exopolysaccharide biosynthesis WecB/TagA/CpsF family protein
VKKFESMDLIRRLTLVPSAHEKQKWLDGIIAVGKPVVVSFLNQHGFVLAMKDPAFAGYLMASRYLFRDGVGISVLLRLLGIDPGINMNGTDLTPEIIRSFAGKGIALCGTQEPWLTKAAEAVEGMGGKVVLKMDGFQPVLSYAEALTQSGAALIILGMGMPKQEAVSASLARKLDRSAVIVNGGAIFDFMAGRFPRAPLLWRRLRLEWLFRLIQEPRRMARRYILGGAEFLVYSLRLGMAMKWYARER